MRKLKNSELKRLKINDFKASKKADIIIVLDNIRSLNNIGSIFRTADAFRVKKILLCGITAQPPHRDIQKTALGATESVCWKYFNNPEETISFLIKKGYTIYPIEQTSKKAWLQDYSPKKTKLAFVFGNEINGVSIPFIKAAENCIEIPQFGTKHSFNVAVSTGIVLWEVFKKSNFYL